MNPLLYHIASGQAFFTGVVLLLIAAVASNGSRAIYGRIVALAFPVGTIAVVVSSTAIPYVCYAIAAAVTLAWIVSRWKPAWRRATSGALAVVWLFAAGLEVPYHVMPSLGPSKDSSLAIIGDSVTAGIGGDEKSETWPKILAREHQLVVQDISHVGETAASALKRVQANPITAGIVVIEIGGNDLLGTTAAAQFGRDLDALLSAVARADRQIILFELPLPPFYHEYGRIQRAIATKHRVHLVPKRVFLSVLAGSDSTLDSIHLSQAGHQRMADCVWGLVKRE